MSARLTGGGRSASGLRARAAMLLPALVLAAACGQAAASADTPPVSAADSAAGPAVRIRFVPVRGGPGAPELTVELADETGTRTVRSRDLRTTEEIPAPHSPWFPTADRGVLRVAASLASAAGGALGGGRIELPLQPDARYEVSVFAWRPDPRVPPPPCAGCVRQARFPLVPDAAGGVAAGDSLVIRAVRVEAGGPVH